VSATGIRGVLSRKGVVAILGLGCAGGLLGVSSRPWVSGAVSDPVLGAIRTAATGGEVAPGLSALALAIAAGAIAVVATGRIARVVALVGYAACLIGAILLTARVVLDPGGVLGPVAAARVGRTGSVTVRAEATPWPWLAFVVGALGAVGLVGALLGLRTWSAPSARYERPPDQSSDAAGPRGERTSSVWDDLSAGRDPTEAPDATDVGGAPPT
jgi:uncharacterized membrane protein (TIGR02234 family)